jgi:hypothetical protein
MSHRKEEKMGIENRSLQSNPVRVNLEFGSS